MDSINNYLRIGTEYYRICNEPFTYDTIRILRKWKKHLIIDDLGKDVANKISKFYGFCVCPSHSNYQQVINGYYNNYSKLSYEPKEGSWNTIEQLLKHIFNEQYNLGLDYLNLLWKEPKQKLPILCLVSKERETGKTTFLNLLKHLFETNVTLNTNEDFRSNFNSDWASKLLICIDETFLDKKEDSERIKNLSTSNFYKSEAKGKDKEEVEFIGKFVLCSNNEDSFIKIDANETRYWVRKIEPLEKQNPNLLEVLKSEIPAFAHFLENRKIESPKVSRMWFSPEQIYTNALQVLKSGNKNLIESEIRELLIENFEFFNVDELCYSSKDILELLKAKNINSNSIYISKIIQNEFNICIEKNSSYKFYNSNSSIQSNYPENDFINKKGRYFRFLKKDFVVEC